MVAALKPSYPVYCLRPHVLRRTVQKFLDLFPGRVLYAVKCNPHPTVRVRAEPPALADLNEYEAFTCLTPGATLEKPQFDRDEHGAVQWSWKRGVPAPRARGLEVNLNSRS